MIFESRCIGRTFPWQLLIFETWSRNIWHYPIGQKFVGQDCRNFGWRRKFCSTKSFVRRKFRPIFEYKSQTKIRQNCWNFSLVSKILSDEITCPTKILSDEVLFDKVFDFQNLNLLYLIPGTSRVNDSRTIPTLFAYPLQKEEYL